MGQRFDALIFDLDDTFWEVGPVIVRAEHAMYEFLARRYPRVTERHDLASMRDLRARTALEHPRMRHDFTWLRLESLRLHAVEAGYDPAMADEAFEVFYRARNEVELYPDVIPALAALRKRYRLFALSNGNADLEVIGLGGYFELHATARTAGVLKPDARAFRFVLDRAGIAPGRIAHVGDDPDADIAGARGAGITAIWISRDRAEWPGGMPPPDHVVADLEDLVAWLES